MDRDREEHNPQQTRGRNGLGCSCNKNQEISEGDVAKQKEPRRGRPRSELSEQERKEKHITSCRAYRERKKAERHDHQDFINEFQEEFGFLRPKRLKGTLMERAPLLGALSHQKEFLSLGVPEEVFEDIRKGTSPEELWKVWQTSKLQDKIPAQKEILQDKVEDDLLNRAEFSRFQQTEIKEETMCEKCEVTEEGVQKKSHKGKCLCEKCEVTEEGVEDCFYLEDKRTAGPSDVVEGNEEWTEWVLLGSEEAAMNEPSHPDDDKRTEGPSDVGNEEWTEWVLLGSEEVAINEPSHPDDDGFYWEDKRTEGPSDVGNEEWPEWEALLGSGEVAMNEPNHLDDVISSPHFQSATFNTAEPSRKKLPSGAKPCRHAVAPSITSFLRFPSPHFSRMFDYPQVLGSHHNAHKHEQAAQQNVPATHHQQYHPLALFPADRHQQHTSSIPFTHSPGMDQTVGAAVFVNVWQVPIQPQQHLLSSLVPHQSSLGVSTNPDALSPTTDVDHLSADIDLNLHL